MTHMTKIEHSFNWYKPFYFCLVWNAQPSYLSLYRLKDLHEMVHCNGESCRLYSVPDLGGCKGCNCPGHPHQEGHPHHQQSKFSLHNI
jgi:hypothetical protein